ncbi:MAG: ABC transporter permease [Oliverpabstia sp.]|nr:ABC transporter permease [Oliverpabstia sp.]
MKQFFTVLKFELNNYFKNKSFLMTTVLLAVLAVGAIVVPALFMGDESSRKEKGQEEAETMAIFDESGVISDLEEFSSLMGKDIVWKQCDDGGQVRKLVEQQEVSAGFLVQDLLHYTYVVENNSMTDSTEEMFSQALITLYRDGYLTEKGIDSEEIQALYQTIPESKMEILGKNSVKNYAYTYMLVMVLYFLLIFYGQMISVSITTEKSNRAIEILVTSVNSNSLIFGKVLAGAIAGVMQCIVILGSAVAAYQMFRENWNYQLDFLLHIPGEVWAAFVILGLLGYLLYAFFFGMLGALVSKTEDISKAATPIMMIYLASFFIAIFGMYDSDSLLMRVASFVPFTSSNAMLIRVAMGSVEIWEVVVSGGLLAASCVLAGVLAAKIFRFGTLMYGNPVKLSTALKKIREK